MEGKADKLPCSTCEHDPPCAELGQNLSPYFYLLYNTRNVRFRILDRESKGTKEREHRHSAQKQ